MRPILFHWREIKVYGYTAMLYLGIVLGMIAGNYAAHLAGLNSYRIFIATLLLLIPALVASRLLFVALHWEIYHQEPQRIWNQAEGGGALYGGLLCSLIASVPLLSTLQIPLGAFWDIATFMLLVGTIFARFGCLLNGCCGGRATEGWLALYLPNYKGMWQRRIPTQLLEAGWATLLLVAAVIFWNRMPFSGALFLSALTGYGIGRFVLESTREEQDRIGKVEIHQVISAVLVVVSLSSFLIAQAL